MYTNFFVTVYLKVIILFYLINSFLFIIVFFVGSHGINACVLEERDSKVRLQETPGNWYIWSQFFLIRNRQFFTGTDSFFAGILLFFLKTQRLFRQDIWQGHKIISVKKKFHKYHINLQFV